MRDTIGMGIAGAALLGVVVLITLVVGVCQRPAGTPVRDPRAGSGEVVMVVGGYEVQRYENERVVCFSWGGVHGSVTCQDKPR